MQTSAAAASLLCQSCSLLYVRNHTHVNIILWNTNKVQWEICWLKFRHVSVCCRHEGLNDDRWNRLSDHIIWNNIPVNWELEEDWNILVQFKILYTHQVSQQLCKWLCQIHTICVVFNWIASLKVSHPRCVVKNKYVKKILFCTVTKHN